MALFFSSLLNIVFPIMLIAATGYAARRSGLVSDSRTLSRITIYVFAPALVLNSVARSKLSSSDLASLIIYAIAVTLLLGVVSLALARVLRLDRLVTSAFLLSIMFVNAGNIGIPFNQFAFGQEGLARAAVYFVGSSLMSQTLAIFIASSGHRGARESLMAVLKMPLVYAAILGVILNRTGWVLPEPLDKALTIAAGAAVPTMLVMLGMELARIRLSDVERPVLIAAFVKLFIVPFIALGLAIVMGLQGLTRSVAVIEASMPAAVMSSLIAVEFEARPDFVTSVVVLTTLGGTVTLVLLLLFLGYSG